MIKPFTENKRVFLNIGCGSKPEYRPYDTIINTDIIPYRTVDIQCASESLPFPDNTFSWIFAYHVLEHTQNLDRAMRECHRVLRPYGMMDIRVPYGLRALTNPFHNYAFDMETFKYWTHARDGDSCLQNNAWFEILSIHANRGMPTAWQPPFQWHIKRYLPRLYRILSGDSRDMDIGIGWRHEIDCLLIKLPKDET